MSPRLLVMSLLGCLALIFTALSPAVVTAQGGGPAQPDRVTLVVGSVKCETQDPTSCSPYAGAAISAALEDSTSVGACVTELMNYRGGQVATCSILVDFSTRVIISQDLTTIPDGYEVEDKDILYEVPDVFIGGDTGPSDISFVSYRVQADVTESTAMEPDDTMATATTTVGDTEATEPLTSETDGSTTAIFAGDCDGDFSADPVATLTNVRPPGGETAGADTASAVETSFTTLDLPLDDLLADDHVLVVFDEDDDAVPLVCGAIGGVVTDDGNLAFGLPVIGDSLFSGVAYLTADGDQTDATVFLAENLSGTATPAA